MPTNSNKEAGFISYFDPTKEIHFVHQIDKSPLRYLRGTWARGVTFYYSMHVPVVLSVCVYHISLTAQEHFGRVENARNT
jgi:hypothetical protein